MNTRIVLAGLAAAMLVAVTACTSSTTDGEPKPMPKSGSSSSNDSATSPSTSTKASSSLADADPCSLLTRSEAEQVLGPLKEAPAQETLGSSLTCEFSPTGKSLSVGTRTNVGLSGVPAGGGMKDLAVGGHQAKQGLLAGGSCGVYLGITSSSRVDVVLNAGASTDPCPLALKIAELVEPKLP
ncbi:DUF3558 domain-containing protein [Lentzea sp. NPDC060358]|uniref:DUF3558 domain-containing protein n=1 Tax=Lentzea sp. NPDC060358 TaxID=3347103 RepID=UPI00365918A2